MNSKASAHTDPQRDLFRIELQHLVDRRHPLVQLADQIQWSEFDAAFAPLFCADNGRSACPVRLMAGLHYLKHTFDLSDEDTVAQCVESRADETPLVCAAIRIGNISAAASSPSIGFRLIRHR